MAGDRDLQFDLSTLGGALGQRAFGPLFTAWDLTEGIDSAWIQESTECRRRGTGPMELETRGDRLESGRGWRDHLGFVGPFQPGVGPRSDPAGGHPTGPNIGGRLPAIVATSHDGRRIDVHEERADRPLVMVFFSSAVW